MMAFKPLCAKNLIAVGLTCLLSSSAFAFSYSMNAMCYLEGKGETAQAFNPTAQEIRNSDGDAAVRDIPTKVTDDDVHEKFRLASLSKVLVSHWAIAKLGPEYRFKTTFYLSRNLENKSCYAHIKGSYDIFLGKEIMLHALDQLHHKMKAQDCKYIAQLTYDENLVIPKFSNSEFILQHRDASGYRGNNPVNYYGPNTTLASVTLLVRKMSPIRADIIKPSLSKDFAAYLASTPMKAFSFKSRPLYMTLREFNGVSSNVPANLLFEKLGGRSKYNEFIQDRLSMSTDEVDVYNGSGYPVDPDGDRKDNKVSCNAFVKVMQDLDGMLHSYQGSKKFQLADIMAVGGSAEGPSTFGSLYGGGMYENTLVAKTGSANEAITFGGMISTSDGPLYFGAFTRPSAYEQLNKPRKYIRELVTILMERYKLEAFNYQQIGLMNPFDAQAELLEETTLSTSLK